MSTADSRVALESTPSRSMFLTVLAWTLIGLSVVLLPISLITALMLVAQSYGTASADLGGILRVVLAPPATLIAGIALLRRYAWAWYYVVLLLGGIALSNGGELLGALISGGGDAPASGSGPIPWTPGSTQFRLLAVGLSVALLGKLWSRPVRSEFGIELGHHLARTRRFPDGPAVGPDTHVRPGSPLPPSSDWRVGHQGRDGMYYEERHDAGWHRLDIDGEMLMGPAHHVIYFRSAAAWQAYPEWARHRRAEIMGRIKSEFRPPDYEYYEEGTGGAEAPVAPIADATYRRAMPAATASQRHALWMAIAVLFCIAGGMGWLVKSGLDAGSIILPVPRTSHQRALSRQQEPMQFWLALGIYAAIGLGTGGLALRGLLEVHRITPRRR